MNYDNIKYANFNRQDREEIELFSKQMWDSEKCDWVPYSLWGANFIINERKEHLCLRIYMPINIQPSYGPTIKGWHTLDSSFLNDYLKKDKDYCEKGTPFKSFAGYQGFHEMMR